MEGFCRLSTSHDGNAVDIAQSTHEAFLKKSGCMLENETLVYGRGLPDGDVLEGLYIDDHSCVGEGPTWRRSR